MAGIKKQTNYRTWQRMQHIKKKTTKLSFISYMKRAIYIMWTKDVLNLRATKGVVLTP